MRLQTGVAARFYSEGATGSPRASGSEDTFLKRERAQEDYFIKKHEKDQLAHLKEQLKQQQKKIDSLEEKLENITK